MTSCRSCRISDVLWRLQVACVLGHAFVRLDFLCVVHEAILSSPFRQSPRQRSLPKVVAGMLGPEFEFSIMRWQFHQITRQQPPRYQHPIHSYHQLPTQATVHSPQQVPFTFLVRACRLTIHEPQERPARQQWLVQCLSSPAAGAVNFHMMISV